MRGKAPTVDTESSGSVSELAKWLMASQQQGPKGDTPPSSVYGNTVGDIGDYLDFICIPPHKRHNILTTLIENNINSYKMFKNLSIEDLKALGLNVGIITKLRSNVKKYKAHQSHCA